MKLDHIRTFIEVAATGNFNQAARNLRVTQSTVSARVKTLEESFGCALFVRNHNGVELTPAGYRFRRYASGMDYLWRQSHQEVWLAEGFSSVLALGAQVSLWERLVLQWIAHMRRHTPDVALRVEADYSSSLMRQLSDGLLDIGVMYQPRYQSGLIIEDLLEETLVLVATTQRDLRTGWVEDYVFVDWGDSFRADHGSAFPEMPTPSVSVGLGALGLQYILQNGGSGYFPLRVVEPLLAEGRLHRVDGAPQVKRPVYVVYAAGAAEDPTVSQALQALRRVVEDT